MLTFRNFENISSVDVLDIPYNFLDIFTQHPYHIDSLEIRMMTHM